MLKKTLFINGNEKRVVAEPETTLANVLRNQMFLSGTKVGCGKGECGACTVILNGAAVKSCITKIKDVPDDAGIITIEGVGTKESLHPLQLAWMIHAKENCGFCTPGFIVSAKALLDQNADPTKEEVINWFREKKHVCSCSDSETLAKAVLDAAKAIRNEAVKEELWSKLKTSGALDDTALAKVTGTLDFGADLGLKLPEGTLHIKLVQAKVPQAGISSVDVSEALKMPGVYKVITSKDVPGTNLYSQGDGKERTILNDRKIFQTGDTIAMVLAFTSKLAEEAAGKVKVELEGTNISSAEAEAPLSLEPEVGFAYLDERGKLIIHGKNNELNLHMLADGIGVPVEKLSVTQNPTRDGAESKLSLPIESFLGIAALVAKKPVYLEL